MKAHLSTRGLTARYGAAQVLHGVDVAVRRGRVTAILGANGAGKTTLLRAISRTVASCGDIYLGEHALAPLGTEDVARLGVGHVPEDRGTFAGLTVEDNLRLGCLRQPRRAQAARLAEVYDLFPKLRQRQRQQAGTLSGGEQQMLAIGRALVGQPQVLLLDEPSIGLAPIVIKEIFSILKRVNAGSGVTMLLVDQNAARTLELADYAYVLETGRIVREGPSAHLARDPTVRAAYLGN